MRPRPAGRRVLALVLCGLVLAVAPGCSKRSTGTPSAGRRIEGPPLGPNAPGEPPRSERVLEVVATTSVVADWLRVVGSVNVHTSVMVDAGLDPVTYLTTPADVEALAGADLVVAVGRGMEPWLEGVRQQAGGKGMLVTLSDGLPERTTPSGAPDPFVWLDVANAKQMVSTLATALATVDPVDQAAFAFSRDAYLTDLDRADKDVRRILGPVMGRGLVTAKETFGWFAARYGLDLVGTVVPSLNGLGDTPPQHLAALLQALPAKQVKAVFAEASVPDASVRTVARDANVKAVVGADALRGDGLGPAGTDSDTFLGVLRHNARSVADNLA
jgi:ABC-type Zn uptake system ZnuABC Zn-binding protein ZnuA